MNLGIFISKKIKNISNIPDFVCSLISGMLLILFGILGYFNMQLFFFTFYYFTVKPSVAFPLKSSELRVTTGTTRENRS